MQLLDCNLGRGVKQSPVLLEKVGVRFVGLFEIGEGSATDTLGVGRATRPGRSRPSNACGALVAYTKEVQQGNVKPTPSPDRWRTMGAVVGALDACVRKREKGGGSRDGAKYEVRDKNNITNSV